MNIGCCSCCIGYHHIMGAASGWGLNARSRYRLFWFLADFSKSIRFQRSSSLLGFFVHFTSPSHSFCEGMAKSPKLDRVPGETFFDSLQDFVDKNSARNVWNVTMNPKSWQAQCCHECKFSRLRISLRFHAFKRAARNVWNVTMHPKRSMPASPMLP